MEYLKIKSKGEIDLLAFTLLGGSTKVGDSSKVGMFGSGLKYAISSLMRNKIEFNVFSGTTEVEFTVKETKFRDNTFDVIYINGVETSLTTTMGGEDWDNSFAPIREVYSNALDEDTDATIDTSELPLGEKGHTIYYIEMTDGNRDFFINIEKYFINKSKNVLFTTRFGSVYHTQTGTIRQFRKGILARETRYTNSAYAYNSPLYKINESRVLANSYEAEFTDIRMWIECNSSFYLNQFIELIKMSNHGSYERSFDWDHYRIMEGGVAFSEAWDKLVDENKFVAAEHYDILPEDDVKGRITLPLSLIAILQKNYGERIDILNAQSTGRGSVYSVAIPSEVLINKVIDAMAILNSTEYKTRLTQPTIIYAKFESPNILARAIGNNSMVLSVKMDTVETDKVAKIIIEENEHNVTGYEDETRNFQNHLFSLYFESIKAKADAKV